MNAQWTQTRHNIASQVIARQSDKETLWTKGLMHSGWINELGKQKTLETLETKLLLTHNTILFTETTKASRWFLW